MFQRRSLNPRWILRPLLFFGIDGLDTAWIVIAGFDLAMPDSTGDDDYFAERRNRLHHRTDGMPARNKRFRFGTGQTGFHTGNRQLFAASRTRFFVGLAAFRKRLVSPQALIVFS